MPPGPESFLPTRHRSRNSPSAAFVLAGDLASSFNARDVTSLSGRASSGIAIKRLDQFARRTGEWREVLVEDRTAGPAQTAAARIDWPNWLHSLSRRQRAIACTLASGESSGTTARKFGLSAARISQLRAWLREH